MIAIKELSKSYGSKLVLDKINLSFEKGKVYGIVGENGAGKTTLFRCLAGLEAFDGFIQTDYDILKNHLGFLSTNPVFMSRITGWEYLKLLCIARGIKDSNFETQNIFGLPLNQYAETYSTGMKKKLALMGILLQKNEVFIFDEPYNGVDLHSNMLITQIIQKLKSLDKTILISSHIFSTLAETCDQIHHLKEGQVERSVEPAEFSGLEMEMRENSGGGSLDGFEF